ncbi:MAG TPA: thiamine pyrophosphate-binding protein [Terriglobales bacterium]|nr:thiamine pyrophosphate-binding protein [Terriglobales bacterium]
MKVKLSDYIVSRLQEWGARHVFLVTGGGAMHLNDSFGKAAKMKYVCTHHEQAAAIAAEGYARITGTPGVLNVTTGPGGINALNGVFGAWTDSIPMLILSGQVKRETCMATYGRSDLRQLGDQEVDIIRMVKGITKYSAFVDDPNSIAYHLERAWHLAQTSRPGPCWLDIPIDVQSAQIEPEELKHYDPAEDDLRWDSSEVADRVHDVLKRIAAAERPVILAGTGVRLANALPEFEQVIRALRIPVTTAWTHDLIASDDELFCGRPGTIGERAGNFTVQNADLVLVLGSRLNIRQISYNWASFARNAFKIQVDVDAAELDKPTVKPELAIHCHLKLFLSEMAEQLTSSSAGVASHEEWLSWCKDRRRKYPVVRPEQRACRDKVNPYAFVESLFANLRSDDVVVCGNASACIVPFQAGSIKKGQRLISNSGSASMGYDLPAAVGAAVARGGGRVICLAGDGSLQMNIQELQTLFHHQLPVKLFVLNNGGYLSIRATQTGFFGRLVGESSASGVSFPSAIRLAAAYGIASQEVKGMADLPQVWSELDKPGPSIIEVHLDPKQEFEPRIRSRQLPDGRIVSPNLEDMYPFLSPEELASNMITEAEKVV